MYLLLLSFINDISFTAKYINKNLLTQNMHYFKNLELANNIIYFFIALEDSNTFLKNNLKVLQHTFSTLLINKVISRGYFLKNICFTYYLRFCILDRNSFYTVKNPFKRLIKLKNNKLNTAKN
jgi:hypothetical protein